jgi:hypothetical protein
VKTEAESVGEIQLSSPHADDHIGAKNEELLEAKTENEVCYKNTLMN